MKIIALCLLFISTTFSAYHYLSAPYSPFKADGSIDYTKIVQQVAYETKVGTTHILINGGMSQWGTLTIDERKKIAEEWIKYKTKDQVLIVHVTHPTLAYSLELAAHARKIGADAIGVLPPSYPQQVSSMNIFYKMMGLISEASGHLPFYYYHFPGSTGVQMKMVSLIKDIKDYVPNFVGIKYVDGDFNDFVAAMNMGVDMFWANEPKLQSLPFGTKSFILAETFYLPFLNDVVTSFYGGKETEAFNAQKKLDVLHDAVGGCAKYVFRMMGLDLGDPRLPGSPVSDSDYKTSYDKLVKIGFFNRTMTLK